MVRSAVEMFTVAAAPAGVGVTGLTGKLQLVSFGSPVQLKLTGWSNPAIELSTTVYVAVPPATIVPLGVIDPIEKSCVCTNPLPVSSTICGLPGALSLSVKAPTLDAVDDGVNVTLIVQFVVGCSAVVQLSVSAKSPLAVMLEKVIGVVPSFVATTPCGAEVWPTGTLPKSRLAAESVNVEAVPVRSMVCGLSGAESVMVIVALLTPGVVGLNVATMVHFVPGFSEEGATQVDALEIAKAFGFAPPSVMLEIVCGLSPFVSVTVSGALVVFKLCAEKVSAAGFSWMPSRMLTLEMNASQFPPGPGCSGFDTGKFVEQVCPAMYAEPDVSTAIPFPLSVCVPPR